MRSNNRILDLGCENGEVGHWIGENNTVIGLDVCPKAIMNAFNNPTIKYKALVIGDGVRLPFPDNYFDVVVAFEVIEHTVDTDGFVSEIRRVLKRNGKLIISCPNLVSIWNRISMLFGSGVGIGMDRMIIDRKFTIFVGWSGIRYPEQVFHIRFFTFKSLKMFLERYGFKKLELLGSESNIQ